MSEAETRQAVFDASHRASKKIQLRYVGGNETGFKSEKDVQQALERDAFDALTETLSEIPFQNERSYDMKDVWANARKALEFAGARIYRTANGFDVTIDHTKFASAIARRAVNVFDRGVEKNG